MDDLTLPRPSDPSNPCVPAAPRKATLVEVGLYALSHGHWEMVAAVTCLIRARGWSYA